MEQIARLKDFIANGGVKKTTKPKAFVLKKAKPTPAPVEEKKEEKPTKETSMHKVEKVVRPPKSPAVKKDLRLGFACKLGRVSKIPMTNEPITFTHNVARGKARTKVDLEITTPVSTLRMAPTNPPHPTHKRFSHIKNSFLITLN